MLSRVIMYYLTSFRSDSEHNCWVTEDVLHRTWTYSETDTFLAYFEHFTQGTPLLLEPLSSLSSLDTVTRRKLEELPPD